MSAQTDAADRRALLREALRTVEDLQARLEASEKARHEPIAVVGLGCRYPGADGPGSLWRLLKEGVDAIGEVPGDRWDPDTLDVGDAGENGRTAARLGGFLDRVDLFDPAFFGISPREAVSLDPQQRLLLEVAWETLEDAAQAPDRLKGSRTGVFVGITTSDYAKLVGIGEGGQTDVYAATGNALNAAAGRIAFVLGLQGPCMAVDTACSSSLTATHLACQSLRAGDCDLALAGGVNVVLSPDAALLFSRWGMLASDGRCKTFDAAADGFVRSEGCGMVALKTLSRAQADGDRILALLLGSAVNQDGASSGLTVPNGPAQQAVLRRALEVAGIGPEDVDYVEAHGTGTPIGDPIEVEALATVMRRSREPEHPLLLGSIKTNIGHAEAASGMAGLLKVVLSLENEAIPPHLHVRELNPRFSWGDRLKVPTRLTPWIRGERRRIAGVSAFGFSGTNAHVVVAEAPLAPASEPCRRPIQVLTLSARADAALAEGARRLEEHLAVGPPAELADVAFTLNTGRASLPRRAAILARDRQEARERLAALSAGQERPAVYRGRADSGGVPRIAFLFTGQGSQYPGMGRELYETQPVFRAELDRCEALVQREGRFSLLEVMIDGPAARLDRTEHTQPALFAVEWALARLWRSWGVEPSALLGHSVGEYVAACVAGVMDLESALRLVLTRGRLMGALPEGGAMVSCLAPEGVVRAFLGEPPGPVSIAAINGPESVVISGPREEVERCAAGLDREGVKTKPIAVSHAFHSALLEPMLGDLEREAAGITYRTPNLDVVSNLTGRLLEEGEVDARYWARHARESVRFLDGIKALRERGCTLYLEIGPQPVLLGMGQTCVNGGSETWLPSLRKGRSDWEQILETLARLHCLGATVDWRGVDRDERRQKLALPPYPFQRERYWVEPRPDRQPDVAASGSTGEPIHPLLGRRLRSAVPGRQFEGLVGAGATAYLLDHALYGQAIFPGAGYLEIALATAAGDAVTELRDVTIEQPLLLSESGPRLVQSLIDDEGRFRVFSLEDGASEGWRRHATGRVERLAESPVEAATVDGARGRCSREIDTVEFYDRFRAAGVDYGPGFRAVEALWAGDGEAIGRLRHAVAEADGGEYQLHPALLDGAFQVLGALLLERGSEGEVLVPTGVKRLRRWGVLRGSGWAQASLGPADSAELTAELRLFDESGRAIAAIEGLSLRRLGREALLRLLPTPHEDWLYETTWEKKPASPANLPPGRWIVVAGRDPVGDEIVDGLRSVGRHVETVDSTDLSSFEALLEDPAERPGVVYLGALDDDGGAPRGSAAGEPGLEGALRTAQALARRGRARLFLVTRGAHAVSGDATAPHQRSLWGLGATIAAEHPELGCVRVDLDPEGGGARALLGELAASDGEEEVAFRGDTRFVARLSRLQRTSSPTAEGAFHLKIARRGSLDGLTIASYPRRAPGPGEVEVRVRASGLNFRDVLSALGMYPGPPLPLGSECAGQVIALGDEVSGLAVGDEVVAMASGAFATHVTTRADFVVKRPPEISAEEAATIPSAFLTADHALHHLGRMKRGERVLIHAAAGGVGMAAVQLARRCGAEVFATAGSPKKREFLRSLGLDHVMGSRDLDFAAEVRRRTGGEGVDLVLNALSDEFIPESLALLRPGGRFLEIGKRGIWDQEKVAAEYPGIEYHTLDMGEVAQENPPLVRRALETLLKAMADGDLTPLPVTRYWLSDAVSAFRFMAQAKHVGKIVLRPGTLGGLEIRPNATYLVTGGLGGLGLATARWLAEQGATRLVLVGRSAPSAEARAALEEIEALGSSVDVRQVDVSQGSMVRRLIEEVASVAPLKGVVHAAGVVADGALASQTWEHFQDVLGPKVAGAWALHEATLDADLDFFVMFSSASAVLGSPGQANYAAANAALDGLAHHRRARGLPALSVNWGAWSEVGMAARLGSRARARQADLGLGTIPTQAGLAALGDLIGRDAIQATVLPVDWSTFLSGLPFPVRPPRYEKMAGEGTGRAARVEGRRDGADTEALQRALDAAPPEEQRAIVEEHVHAQVVRTLGLDPNRRLGRGDRLSELGIDSLMAVEIRNGIEGMLGVSLPLASILEGASIEELTRQVLVGLSDGASSGETPREVNLDPTRAAELLEGITDMPDDQVSALLESMVGRSSEAPEGGS